MRQEIVTRTGHLFGLLDLESIRSSLLLRPEDQPDFRTKEVFDSQSLSFPATIVQRQKECDPHGHTEDFVGDIIGLRRHSPRTPGGFGFDFEIRVKIVSRANVSWGRSRSVWGFERDKPPHPQTKRFMTLWADEIRKA